MRLIPSLLVIFLQILVISLGFSQPFIPATNTTYIAGMSYAALDWGDYDNDNDLDLIMIGLNGNTYLSKIYTNNLGSLYSQSVNPGIYNGYWKSTASWADVDNDGDLDYAMSGSVASCTYSPIVRNDDICLDNYSIRKFVLPPTGLAGVNSGNLDWGDFDNDGDLDIVLAGTQGNQYQTIIYENISGNFQIYTNLLSVTAGRVLWADVDNDQDLDLYMSGYTSAGIQAFIMTNTNGVFSNSGNNIVGCSYGDSDFGDYDNDGDLDLIVTGDTLSNEPFSMLYNNNGGIFSPVVTNIAPIRESTVEWGDYDNDGDLDLIAIGDTSHSTFASWEVLTRIYRNDGANIFTPITHSIVDTEVANVKWADHDNDGDLDFLLTGYSWPNNTGKVYENHLPSANANTIPSAPNGLTSSISNYEAYMHWNKSIDAQTPQNGLNYNIRVGTSPSGIEIVTPMSNLLTGYRRKAEIGNTDQNNSWRLKNLIPGDYFWSAQAIDGAFAGSMFSNEEKFIVMDTAAPTLQYPYNNSVNVAVDTILNWYSYPGALTYQLQLDTSLNFTSLLLDSINITDTLLHSLLDLGTNYHWRVRANTASGYSNWSYIKTFTTHELFTHEIVNIPGITGESKFGDFDNDSDMDIAVIGSSNTPYPVKKVFENVNNTFVDYGANLLQFYSGGGCSWGDFDSDNDLDLFALAPSINESILYENANGNFVSNNLNIALSNDKRTIAWSDFDNDGDLDFAVLGKGIYRNNFGSFNLLPISFPNTVQGDLAWGDYDNDLDMDLFVTGSNGGSGYSTRIFRNDGNALFTQVVGHGLQQLTHWSRVRLGDFDEDGDLDVLLSGQGSSPGYPWSLYSNTNGVFALQQAVFDGINFGDIQWGDLDNDGDLDFVVSGANKTYVYLYNGSQFIKEITLQGMNYVSIDIGDYDNDNDLDIIMSGQVQGYPITKLYKNNSYYKNTKPNPPSGLSASQDSTEVNFSWNSGSDPQTATPGLTYNLYVGSTPASTDVLTPMADIVTGKRRITSLGNANSNLSWKLKNLPPGTYYWSVQSIDNNFEGSIFSPEQSFVVSCNTSSIDTQIACDSLVWIDGNTYTSSNNTATWTLPNSAGCDSVITLDLTVYDSSVGTGIDIQTACDSYTWLDGNTYTANNNTATWILANSNGCDSVITLDLTILNSSNYTDVQTACDTYTWLDGNTYTSSNNTATWILANSNGCDSVITLDLTILNSSNYTDVQTACETYTWIDGNIYTTSNNTATWLFSNSAGCDSLVTLDLTIVNSSEGTDFQTACESYTWIDGNTYSLDNNTATWMLTNAAGCDSLVTLNLLITSIDVSTAFINNITIVANTANAQYQWLDCSDDFAPIAGETTQTFIATENGIYAVVITENGCADTSACVIIDKLTMVENDLSTGMTIYPNPSSGLFHVVVDNGLTNIRVQVFDLPGKLISEYQFDEAKSFDVFVAGVSGQYVLKIVSTEG